MILRYVMKRRSSTAGWTTWVRGSTTAPPNWKSCLDASRSLKRAGRLRKGDWRLPSTRSRSKRLWDHRYVLSKRSGEMMFLPSLRGFQIPSLPLIPSGVQCKEPGAAARPAGQPQIPEASGGLPQRPGPRFSLRFTGRQHHGDAATSERGRGPGEGVRRCHRQGED